MMLVVKGVTPICLVCMDCRQYTYVGSRHRCWKCYVCGRYKTAGQKHACVLYETVDGQATTRLVGNEYVGRIERPDIPDAMPFGAPIK